MKQLRERIAKQEEEIKRLQQSVEEQRTILEKAVQSLPAQGTTQMVNAANASGAPVKLVPALNVAYPHGGQNQKETTNPSPSPLGISIGNTTFTPLGFMDMTFFARSTNLGSGIGTNFAGTPFNNVAAGHLSETNFSAQNSRIGFRVDSTFMGAKVLGYLEADFLFNNNAGSYQITSNSAGFRLRNYFVDVTKDGFEVLGGQDWSFLTPNRKGLSPIPSDIFYTQNMDTNYQAGLIWTRQPQFRFIAHPNENVAFGVSLENPQQYIGGGGGAGTITIPSALNGASGFAGEFQSGGSALGVPNLFPDIIFKVAVEGHPNEKTMHFEAAGMVRGFKDYVTLTTAPAIHGSHTAVGYAGEVNMNLQLAKNFRLIENAYASDGGGRYIFGIAPDLIVRPNGDISLLHSYSTVDGFEAQVTKNALLGMYYGGAYVARDVTFDPTAAGSTLARPVFAGYGQVGSGGTNNKYVQEITLDWVQTLWKNPNYGALSLINQYSYLFREPWYVAVPNPKQSHESLIYVNLRYTLP
ncbi:MAG: hypothetical protein JO091_03700 [Acidobacteriaceae bacterium]|nr:hypothetical protein [Acidobacteriaceae bacterium]